MTIGPSLSVQHPDDAGEILGAVAAVDEQVEELSGLGAERRAGAGGIRRLLGEHQILQHHGCPEARLAAAIAGWDPGRAPARRGGGAWPSLAPPLCGAL